MHELNIQTIYANTSSAKGRVERAHLTLQDRLVKELRLRGISLVDAANDYADEFMADYNRRFAKAPRHDFDVHRPLETDDDLAAFFTWREPRRVSKSLTVQYDKVLYLIEDNDLSRRAIGKYIEAWHYPDGRKELRINGAVLPYSTYDRLQEIDQGAIVDNKRLGRTLEFIKLVQDKRDNNRSQALPAGNDLNTTINSNAVVTNVRFERGADVILVSSFLGNFNGFCLPRSSLDKVSQPVRSTLNMVVVLPGFIALICLYLKDHKQKLLPGEKR